MTREEKNARIIELLEQLGFILPASLPEKRVADQPDDLKASKPSQILCSG